MMDQYEEDPADKTYIVTQDRRREERHGEEEVETKQVWFLEPVFAIHVVSEYVGDGFPAVTRTLFVVFGCHGFLFKMGYMCSDGKGVLVFKKEILDMLVHETNHQDGSA